MNARSGHIKTLNLTCLAGSKFNMSEDIFNEAEKDARDLTRIAMSLSRRLGLSTVLLEPLGSSYSLVPASKGRHDDKENSLVDSLLLAKLSLQYLGSANVSGTAALYMEFAITRIKEELKLDDA